MSKQSSLDFQLVYGKDYTIIDLFNCLITNGWQYSEDNKVTFLPVGDDGNYDWQCEKMSLNQLQKLMENKIINNEVIGITMTWENTGIGGDYLFWPDGNFSFIINKNRKILIDKITDVNWYLTRIIPVFGLGNIKLIEYKFEEI